MNDYEKKCIVEYHNAVKKDYKRINKPDAILIYNWIKNNLNTFEDVIKNGEKLKGELSDYYKFKLNDYRIVAKMIEEKLVISVIGLGHRKDIYDKIIRRI